MMTNKNLYQPFWANWYQNWLLQHIVLSVMLLLSTIIMYFVSAATMYSSLLNSGNIAFLEHNALAIALSMLSPMASTTIKTFGMSFNHKESRDLFRKILNSLTVISIIYWIVQYSTTIDGMGADIVISDMLNSEGNNAYTHAQLTCEILMGAALFCAWEALHNSYSSRKQINNPQLAILDKEISELEVQLTHATDEIAHHLNTISRLCAKRNRFINAQLEALSTQKAKYQNIKDFFGDKS